MLEQMDNMGRAIPSFMLEQDGVDPDVLPDITSVDQVVEIGVEFAFGLFGGMSFKGEQTCATGLNSIIYYGYEVYTYREFYIPANTMGFTIATEKLTESYNSIYAYTLIIIL